VYSRSKSRTSVVHAYRASLHGWGKYECPGWAVPSRRFRGGCLSLEPAQNLLYPHGGGGDLVWDRLGSCLIWWRSCLGILSSRRGESKALVLLPQHLGRQYPDDFLMYIAMMGAAGLTEATKVAILMPPTLPAGLSLTIRLFIKENSLVAHECILICAR